MWTFIIIYIITLLLHIATSRIFFKDNDKEGRVMTFISSVIPLINIAMLFFIWTMVLSNFIGNKLKWTDKGTKNKFYNIIKKIYG
jgi:Na+/proline symporter